MKRFYLPLSATLCLIVACQTNPSQTTPPQVLPVNSITQVSSPVQIAQVNYTPKPAPFGQAKVLANQQLEVNFTYPDPQQFKTQAFGCGEVSYAKIELTGPALGNTSLYANGADAIHKMIAASNCQVSAIVNAIPYGDLVVNIRLYDSDRNLLAGSELISGFNVSEANPRVEMSYRQTNVGQILNQLRASNQVADEFLAGQLNLDALQTFIDTLTDLRGTFPHYLFTHHPALINVAALVADLRANNGNVAALDPLNPDYVQTPGSVRFDLQGLLTGDTVTASIDDTLSDDVTINSTGEVTIANLPPGTWTLRLSGPGYIDQRITVVVSAGQVTTLDTVTLAAVPPTLSGMTPGSGVNGSSVTLNGTNFHPTAGNNTVRFGSMLADVTHATASQLTVTVPVGLALGSQTVTVAKGNAQAATNLNYTVVKPTLTALNVTAGEIGSQVKITGTQFNPDTSKNTVITTARVK